MLPFKSGGCTITPTGNANLKNMENEDVRTGAE
jgi:hypothetical protein